MPVPLHHMKHLLSLSILLLATCAAFAQDVPPQTAPQPAPEPLPESFIRRGNIVALAPIQFTDDGLGFGIYYERFLDNDGFVSLNLPITYSGVRTVKDYDGNSIHAAMLYIVPGVKIYPTGHRSGKIKYAVGVSLPIGSGDHLSYAHLSSVGGIRTDKYYFLQNKFVFGMLVTNSINLFVAGHFYMGVDANVGYTYYFSRDGGRDRNNVMFQTGCRFGYRF